MPVRYLWHFYGTDNSLRYNYQMKIIVGKHIDGEMAQLSSFLFNSKKLPPLQWQRMQMLCDIFQLPGWKMIISRNINRKNMAIV